MGSLRDKYLNKYTKKQEDEEKEKSPYVNPAQTKDDGTSVRSTLLNKYTSGGKKDEFTADSISTFFLDAEDYLSNAKARYAKIGVSTASDAWEKNRKESSNLLARGYSLRDYLSKNKDSLDEKSYKSMIKQLDSIDDALRGYTSAFRDARQYYSQWDSDEEYQKWKKEMEEYEALKNFDIQAGEKEIGDLEKALNEYKTTIRNATSESEMSRASEIFQKYGDANSINALIAEKKQYLNRAKHLQEGIALAGVINNDDFKDNSGYVSTKTDDRWSRLTSDFGMGYEDLTYEYINGEESGMRQEIINKAVSYDADTEKFFVYDHMTDDQISTYNYYYAKDGKEAAEKYLNSIQEALNYQAATERYEKMEGNTALELLFGIEAGVDQFQSGFKNVFNTEDDYIAQTATQMASGMVREDLADNGVKLPDWLGGASLGQVGYDAITTTMNMAPSIMTSTVLNIIAPGSGAVVGTAMMGASAAGNAYQEMLSLGYDKSQARAYSTLVGASEAGLQYLMGGISNLGGKLTGNALTKMMNGIDNAFLRTALRFAGNMASEGLEEGLQEILTPWFQNLIMHSGENVNWGEVAYSTLLGALTAGVMEGPNTISNAVSIRNTGKNLQNADISAQRLAEIGKTFSADTVAYQLAGRVDGNTGAYTMGRLFNEIGASLSEQNVTEITSALVAKGMDAATAQKNAKARAYVVEGGQLTDKQIAVIEGNEVLADVARSTLIDANTTWNQRTQGYNQALKALAEEMTSPKASRINPAQQSQENAPVSDTVDTRNKNGTESLSEAVDTSPAKVKTISSINNGQVTVKLEDGTEVNLKEADLSVDDGVRIDTIAKLDGISAADANFILNTLRTNTSTSAQMDSLGAREAYKYGYYGFSQEHMATHGVFANSLTDTQRQAIYQTGQNARAVQVAAQQAAVAKNTTTSNKVSNKGKVHFEGDRTSLTERQSASLTAMERVADALGVQIYVFESKLNERGKRVGANGWYDPKDSSIHIDLHAGENGAGTMLFTAAHELTHHVRKWSPEKFKTLSDFLMQEYGKKGVNVDALVREQMAKAERNKRHLSYDEAFEEVVADSMEQMLSDGNVLKRLEKLKAQDKDLWHQIKNFIDKLAAKIREVYKGLTPDSTEANIVAEMGDTIYRLQELFTEGLVDATENYQSSLTPGEEGVVVSDNGDPVAYSTEDGSVLLSMRTYDEEGRKAFRDYLNKCVSSKKLTKEEMQEMVDGIEDIYQTCKEFKDKYAPFSSWSDAAVVRDTYGKPVFSVVTPNGDYKMNLDFSLVCKKRRTLDAVFNEMSKRGIIDDFELGQKSVVKINEIIRKHGLETACALCFVDAKRFRQASMADQFTSLYNELVLSLVPEDQRSSIDHFNFSGYETIKKVEDGIHTWDASKLDFSHLNEVMKNYGSGTVEHKAARYIKAHAEGRRLLLRGDFMSSQGFDAVKTQNKDILKLYNSKKGTGGPKAAFGDVQYMNEIIKKARTWTPSKAYAVGGVRIQSFSDYVPRMVFDYVQMIYDLAATKLPAHAYTKEALFVKQFGLTGVKINMSLIPAIAEGGVAPGLDANGNYVWAGESFDFETAKEIQNAEGYTENCGTICVGVSDRHIRKLLSDPDIRMVIPYHKSGLNPIVAHMNKIAEFSDYTNKQNTTVKGIGAKAEKHFDFNKALHDMGENADPKAVIQQYFDWCDDNGYDPKFADFRDHPNYYKLIEDFTLYDKDGKYVPQREVRAVFPKEGSVFGSMKDLIKAGLEEDAIIEGKKESSLSSIVDEIQKTLPRTEAEIAEEQVAQADKDLEADVKLSDRDNAPTFYSHMAKVVDGVKQEKLGAASVVSMLRGKGVKAEEIKWSGIEAWLGGKKSVTKAELQEFIAGSMLQVEEDTLDYKERPYTEDQKKRLDEYEAKRNEVVRRVADEWKRITGEEFPVQNPGYDLESTVSRKIIDTNLEHKRTSFEGRLLEKLRKDFQKVSENNDDFGFDSWRDALRSVYRNRKDFIKHYEMSTNDKAVIVKLCNALDAQAELQPKISEADTDRLRTIAREATPWDRKIMEVKHEYNEEAAKHMPKWDGRRYNLEGGKNYREVLFRIPDSSYTNDAMFTHWENRSGILAHARIQDFNTFIGKMLFIEELQSDWHNEGHKTGYQDVPDAPFRDNYHEFVLKRLIRMAAEQDYDSIGWTPAQIQVKRWSEKFAEGYRIEYDQDMPKFLNKYGKKWGTRVGKTVLDSGTEVWSMAITDSMKESVLTEGQPLYSDRDVDSVSNRSLLANAFESVAQNDIERQKIQEYKGKISLINSEERKLSELNEKIKDLSFSKGPKDTKAIRDLQFEAKQTANRISTYDKQLLRLEASKPLQDVLTREKNMAYKRAEKKGKEALEAYREKTMKTQRELIDKWQESRKRGIDSRQRTAMRHKIKDVVNELNQYLLRGTKDRHVPESLQKAVAEALDAVNMDTVGAEERIAKLQAELMKAKSPEEIQAISRKIDHIREMGDKMSNRLKKLKDAYDDLLKSPDMNTVSSYDEVIHNKLDSVIDKIGNTALRDMTLAQLEDVYDMYRMVLKAIRDVNKSFKDAKKQSISTRANAVMAQVEEVGGKHKLSLKMLNGIKKFGWNNLKPVYAFEHIGSITLTEAFKNVRAGEDVWALDVTEAREFYLDKYKKYKYDSWDFQKQYKFQSTTGMDFSLNLEQILSLYAYSKRDQAADHLKYGGIVFDESTKIIKKTKMGLSLEFNPTDATAYNISEETLASIISKLTDEQKAFANEMQDYLSTVMGAKGNEVSMAMYDIRLFKDKNYFPLKSAQQFMEKARDQQKGEVKIKNSGFSKETVPHAKNPIVLTPFMEVWSNHVNEMSMYHAFVLPLEDFYRIYNYKTPSNNETLATEGVNQYIQNAYGRGATAYIDQLLKDLNGGARTDNTTGIINKMMGMFKKGAVFASLSVVVQQPSAIARAAALVDTKYFIGPKVDHKKHKVLWDEVKQYAPVAVIKEMGYFDTNMGKSTQDFILGKEYSGFSQKMKALFTDSGYRDEALSKAPALADEIAWCSIWEAVKRETKANYPGLDTKGEPFLKLAGSRFTEVIVKTQVYDSVLSRSGLMRSKDTGMKMATSFMAEPTTSINMIADALLQGKRGNRKYARGAIGAVIASQILNSILVSFVYAGRDDDEDETYAEKYIGTLTGEILDSLNPAGYIPFIKDIQSIVQGYDVERSDMAVISDLWKAWENLSKDSISPYRKVEGFAGSIAQIFGLPVKNIMRDARGIYQTIDSFVNGQKTTKAGIGYAVKGAITGKTVTNDQQLYEAILSGDQAQIARLKGRFEDQTAINNAIRKGLRENDSRIYEAALAQINGHPEERVKLQRQVIADGFTQDDVVIATNTIINNLSPSAGTSEPKKKGLYTTEDFALFVAGGNSSLASEAKKDIIATHQLNGKTADEAEKSFQSSAKTDLKDMLIAGTVTVAAAEHALKTYCGMDAGEAKTKVNEWNYFKSTGVDYSDKREQFLAGEMSASDLVKALVSVEGKTEEEAAKTVVSYTRDAYEDGLYDRSKAADVMVTYGGLTDEEAEAKLRYIDVKKQFPDTFVDDAWVDEYYAEVESSGIPMEVFVDYRNQVKSITGKDKKEGRMAVINSMPISNTQKDALYFAEGWAASKLYEAPWR